ncbi:hypothetical protein Tco_1210642 [Tanacetum coccineum]
MSNNKNLQTNTSSALHNAIIEAGGKDHPPMLAPVDACPNAMEMWKAIERLKQGESINVQDLETTNLNKEKEIVNSPSPNYDSKPEVVIDEEATPRDKEFEKLMALISMSFMKIYKPTNNNLRTSSNIMNKNVDNTPRSDRRTGDSGYHNEKMMLCKQEEAGIPLSVEQVDWWDDTNDKPEDQELEAHYMYMAKIQEVFLDVADNSGPIFDTEPLAKKDDKIITPDSRDMSDNRREADQDDDLVKERDLLASLVEKLTCKIDESKKHNKRLESSNKAFKEANKAFEEANTFLANENDKYEIELDRFQNMNYVKDAEFESEKAYGLLTEQKVTSQNFVKPRYLKKAQSANPRLYDIGCYNDNLALMLAHETDEMIHLAQEISPEMKNVIEQKMNPTVDDLATDVDEFYQFLKKQMVVDLRYFYSLDKDVESLQSQQELQQTQFSNEID